MADTARALGHGAAIEHKGVKYSIRPLTLDDLASFEVWLEDQAFRRIERQRGRVDPVSYQARLDAVVKSVAAGEFQYSGTLAGAAMRTEAGVRFLWHLMLSDNDGMTEDIANEIFDEDKAATSAKMNVANADPADPNAATPAAA